MCNCNRNTQRREISKKKHYLIIKEQQNIKPKIYLKDYLITAVPQFTRLIYLQDGTCKDKSPKTKSHFPLLPAF